MGFRLMLIMRGGGWRDVLLHRGGEAGIAEGPGRGPEVART
jgi:hypothetical protein